MNNNDSMTQVKLWIETMNKSSNSSKHCITKKLPSDASADYFPNEFMYKEIIMNHLLNQTKTKSEFETFPIIVRLCLDSIFSFISLNSINLSSEYITISKYDDLIIGKHRDTDTNIHRYIFYNMKLNKDLCCQMIIGTAIANYFYNETYDKTFIVDKNYICGFIWNLCEATELWVSKLPLLTVNDKVIVLLQLINYIEYYNKRGECSLDFRTVFIGDDTDSKHVFVINKSFNWDNALFKYWDHCVKEIILGIYFVFGNGWIKSQDDLRKWIVDGKGNIKDGADTLIKLINKFKTDAEKGENDVLDIKIALISLIDEEDNEDNGIEFIQNKMCFTGINYTTKGEMVNAHDDDNALRNENSLNNLTLSLRDFDPIECNTNTNNFNPNRNNHNANAEKDINNIDTYFQRHSTTPPEFKILKHDTTLNFSISPQINCHADPLKLLKEMKRKGDEWYTKAEQEKNPITSKSLHESAYSLRKQYLGDYHLDTLISEWSVADILFNEGNYDRSRGMYINTVNKIKENYTAHHVIFSFLYHKIALAYDWWNQFETALTFYFLSIEYKIKYLGFTHISTANTYYNIGGIYDAWKDYTTAWNYFYISLKIYNSIPPKTKDDPVESFECATVYSNIAWIYAKQNNNEEAIKYSLRAIKIGKLNVSESHPLIATCNNNWGLVYFKSKLYDNAVSNWQESIKIRNKLKELGFYNYECAIPYNNWGAVYYNKGELSQAHDNYTKAINVFDDINNGTTPDKKVYKLELSTIYNNIGWIEVKWKNYETAWNYFNKALEIRNGLKWYDDFNTLFLKINQACSLIKIEKYEDAIHIWSGLIGVLSNKNNKNSADWLIKVYGNLGQCYWKTNNMNKCKEYFELEQSKIQSVYGDNKKQNSKSFLHFGKYYKAMKNLTKAKMFITKYQEALLMHNSESSLSMSVFSDNSSLII